jgi:hypothetical protein
VTSRPSKPGGRTSTTDVDAIQDFEDFLELSIAIAFAT